MIETKPACDLLFNDDGTVRLPKYYNLAMAMAADSMKPRMPHRLARAEKRIQARRGLITRQPTEQRALAVGEAVAADVERRGFTTEVRASRSGETFGLYLKRVVPENESVAPPRVACAL